MLINVLILLWCCSTGIRPGCKNNRDVPKSGTIGLYSPTK